MQTDKQGARIWIGHGDPPSQHEVKAPREQVSTSLKDTESGRVGEDNSTLIPDGKRDQTQPLGLKTILHVSNGQAISVKSSQPWCGGAWPRSEGNLQDSQAWGKLDLHEVSYLVQSARTPPDINQMKSMGGLEVKTNTKLTIHRNRVCAQRFSECPK